jgi:ABC-type antimicrobial peptide transport system permease subunit
LEQDTHGSGWLSRSGNSRLSGSFVANVRGLLILRLLLSIVFVIDPCRLCRTIGGCLAFCLVGLGLGLSVPFGFALLRSVFFCLNLSVNLLDIIVVIGRKTSSGTLKQNAYQSDGRCIRAR